MTTKNQQISSQSDVSHAHTCWTIYIPNEMKSDTCIVVVALIKSLSASTHSRTYRHKSISLLSGWGGGGRNPNNQLCRLSLKLAVNWLHASNDIVADYCSEYAVRTNWLWKLSVTYSEISGTADSKSAMCALQYDSHNVIIANTLHSLSDGWSHCEL